MYECLRPHLYSQSISSSVSMCSDTKLIGTASRLRTPLLASSLQVGRLGEGQSSQLTSGIPTR